MKQVRRLQNATRFQVERTPPHAKDAEMAVLGAMMLEPEAVDTAMEHLTESAFYFTRHQMIYRAMLNLVERRSPIDIITLSDELQRIGQLDDVGGAHFLSELNMRTPTAGNVKHHALLVREKSMKRQLIHAAGETIERCYDDANDAHQEIDRAEAQIFAIAEARTIGGVRPIGTVVLETRRRLEVLRQNRGMLSGVDSGLREVNRLTGGFQKSDLVILAARPSMGKTGLALTIARHVAVNSGVPVAFFSLEMSAESLLKRLAGAEAKVDVHRLTTGDLTDIEHQMISDELDRLAVAPLHIDDTSTLTVMELRARGRMLKRTQRIGLIVVDYLQLMHAPNSESREKEIGAISRGLKQVAKDLDVPVIALSQLSREVEKRGNKRPQLSDLRDSGEIEQNADLVMFIHRPEYYGVKVGEDGKPTTGLAELIMAKQRNGPVGTVRLTFLPEYAKFANMAEWYEKEGQSYMPHRYGLNATP
jgi:replicative DNA helicase